MKNLIALALFFAVSVTYAQQTPAAKKTNATVGHEAPKATEHHAPKVEAKTSKEAMNVAEKSKQKDHHNAKKAGSKKHMEKAKTEKNKP